jgi:hypothetical protein
MALECQTPTESWMDAKLWMALGCQTSTELWALERQTPAKWRIGEKLTALGR